MADEKLNVSEFVAKYNGLSGVQAKKNYLKKIKITPYIPFSMKMALADRIVQASSLDQDKEVHINSPVRFMLFAFTVLTTYTNLDMDNTHMHEQYDLLCESGLIDEIIGLIPEREINEFKSMVDITYDDFMTNHYETHAYVLNLLSHIASAIDSISPELVAEFEKLVDING
mgnify:CR=1 FL=1